MHIIKKTAALCMAAVMLAAGLNGCGSPDTEDRPDTPEGTTPLLETCEDFMKLVAESYDRQDWETVRTILEEGIDACGTDSFSQREEYVRAGTVAVRTKLTENEYDEAGKIIPVYASERDRNAIGTGMR